MKRIHNRQISKNTVLNGDAENAQERCQRCGSHCPLNAPGCHKGARLADDLGIDHVVPTDRHRLQRR